MYIDNRINELNHSNFNKKSYSIKEIETLLNISRQSVYKLIKSQLFKVTKISGHYRIDKKSFDDWLDNNEEG